MPKENELKPCKCGRSGHLVQWSQHDRDWYIPCKCGLMITHKTKEQAIQAWNTRPTKQIDEGEVVEVLYPLIELVHNTTHSYMKGKITASECREKQQEHLYCASHAICKTFSPDDEVSRRRNGQGKGAEICICAAVKDEYGNIIRGHRHGDCIQAILNRKRKPMKSPDAQGFITSKGRFVTREEGRKLQDNAGIKSADKDGYRGNTLFSEDLY